MGKKHTALKILLPAALSVPAALAFMAAPVIATEEMKKPFYHKHIAHRGLHTRDKSIPENSLAAFRLAAEKGYPIELDVQLTKDGQVVVFHDDTVDRVCQGPVGRVDSYDYIDLLKFRIEGTDQYIPLFYEVLEEVGGRVPILVELKSTSKRKELCEKTYALLKRYNGEYCMESFDPFIVRWFRLNAPEVMRGQLASKTTDYIKEGHPPFISYLLSHCLMNFFARPHFIAYEIGSRPFSVHLMKQAGALIFGWTSRKPDVPTKDDATIFELYEPDIDFK